MAVAIWLVWKIMFLQWRTFGWRSITETLLGTKLKMGGLLWFRKAFKTWDFSTWFVNALWDQNEKTKTPYNIFCLNWLKILLIFSLKLFRCFAYLSFEGHWWLEILVKTDCNRNEAQLKEIVINNERTNEQTYKRTNKQTTTDQNNFCF